MPIHLILHLIIYLVIVKLYGSNRVLTSDWAMQSRVVTSKWHIIYLFFLLIISLLAVYFCRIWGGFSGIIIQNFLVVFRSTLVWPLISFWPLLLCLILLDHLQTLPSEFLVRGVEYD